MTDSKIHILNCAFRLFLEKGYDAATMMDLVRATGLSKGAFYHHFRNKEDLYHATIEHFFLRFFQTEGTPAPTSLDLYVEMLWQGYARMLTELQKELPDLTSYYRFLFSVLPRVRPELLEHQNAVREGLIERLPEGPHPREQVADHILSLIEGTGMLAVLQEDTDLESRFRDTLGSYLQLIQ